MGRKTYELLKDATALDDYRVAVVFANGERGSKGGRKRIRPKIWEHLLFNNTRYHSISLVIKSVFNITCIIYQILLFFVNIFLLTGLSII